MISVVLECRDQEPALAVTLASLVQGAVEGLVAEVVVVDRGSSDGTEVLADAAGCKFLADPDLRDVVRQARGEWILFIEPGARPLLGWVEHLHQHVMAGAKPARFSPSREYRLPFLSRIRSRPSALSHGVLIPKRQAIANCRSGSSVEAVVRGLAMQKLKCEIVPASVLALA
ncbi:MAG: glycosyl transferase [Rhizobiales bacterium]|nr:glycosyl transferase [Hyphomicrobiales bacterium]MBA67688.1 glycosyl transferase [Hyphomicrobiales bacterium]|tara:strand:+ start:96 stop:611 length:516 start_codon:yes stop_codon:yes gene_type:complete